MSIRVTIVLPADPERLQLGGIASFVRGFTKFAPPDFDLALVGIASGERPRQVGRWAEIELEGRALRFLPVSQRASTARGRVPLALTFTAALRRHRHVIGRERSILQFHRPGTALPLLGLPAPKVRVVHLTTDQLRSAGSESRWRLVGPLLDRLEARAFARMERIYVVNEAAAERYRQRYPRLARRIVFVPNWVDDTVFSSTADAERAALRGRLLARLGLPPTAQLVLYAGRLERQKDPELLIEAFTALRGMHGDAALLVVGAGGLRRTLEERIDANGVRDAVRLEEPVDRHQLAGLMNAADCLVVTSAFETGPTVAYEALACGLPVVSTAVGQVPALLRDGGSGEVVQGRDPQRIGEALQRVLAAPAGAMRAASVAAAAPFRASAVLGRLYDDHRRLAG